jgi:hypothetical protein
MDSSHKLKIGLIKIRLIADIARSAQCQANEYDLVMEIISEHANLLLDEGDTSPGTESNLNRRY